MEQTNNTYECNDGVSKGRAKLLNNIREVGFAITELNLFLDTHPYDRNALAMFKRLCAKKQELTAEYTAKYGPLCVCDSGGDTPFDWVSPAEKWPWERGGED